MDMNAIRIGVIGAGRLGRFHAKLLASMPQVKLVGVVDASPMAADQLAEELHCRAYMDAGELAPHVDAAVIAAPTKYHHQVSMPLLRAGKHLLIEKPIAVDVSEARDLVQAAEYHDVVLQVGHIERFSPAFAGAQLLGSPLYVETLRQSAYTFRSTDIGVVHDLMIHDIDLVLSMTSASVRKVDAWGARVFGPFEDVANARVEFSNGLIAQFAASRVSPESARKMHAWSRTKYVSMDFAAKSYCMFQEGDAFQKADSFESLTAAEKQSCQDRVFKDWLPLEKTQCAESNPLLEELEDFVSAITLGRQPRVDGRQALAAMNLADQVLHSMRVLDWGDERRFHAEHSIIRPPHWSPTPRRREAG